MERVAGDSGERSYRFWLTVYGFVLGIIATFSAGLWEFNATLVFVALFALFWGAEYFRRRGEIPLADVRLISACLWIGYAIFCLVELAFLRIIS